MRKVLSVRHTFHTLNSFTGDMAKSMRQILSKYTFKGFVVKGAIMEIIQTKRGELKPLILYE